MTPPHRLYYLSLALPPQAAPSPYFFVARAQLQGQPVQSQSLAGQLRKVRSKSLMSGKGLRKQFSLGEDPFFEFLYAFELIAGVDQRRLVDFLEEQVNLWLLLRFEAL